MSELNIPNGVCDRDGRLEGGRELLLDTGVSKWKSGDGITGLEGGREDMVAADAAGVFE